MIRTQVLNHARMDDDKPIDVSLTPDMACSPTQNDGHRDTTNPPQTRHEYVQQYMKQARIDRAAVSGQRQMRPTLDGFLEGQKKR